MYDTTHYTHTHTVVALAEAEIEVKLELQVGARLTETSLLNNKDKFQRVHFPEYVLFRK